jgi:hypothetical protein
MKEAGAEELAQSRVARWAPGLVLLRRYKAAWLPHDVAAGLVLTSMLVPVGIGYAAASGVLGIYGLYATIASLLVRIPRSPRSSWASCRRWRSATRTARSLWRD